MRHSTQAGILQVTPGGLARTAQEVDAELLRLANLRRCVAPETRFSSAKGMVFEAQMEVLRRRLTQDETHTLYYRHSDAVMGSALEAADWLRGGAKAPSACWEDLAKRMPADRPLRSRSS